MGPWLLIGDEACEPVGFDPDDIDDRGLNAAMLCDTPSAKMNCSRNSIFVRPLASRFTADVLGNCDPILEWHGADIV